MAKVEKKKNHSKNTKHKILNFFRWVLILILVCVISYCSCYIFEFIGQNINNKKEVDKVHDTINEANPEPSDEPTQGFTFSTAAWQKLYEENSDFKAYLHFDDDSISLPVVQAADNAFYLRRSFYKNHDIMGVPFFDFETTMQDDNMIIYGHSVDYGPQNMFSPLLNLTTQDGYNSCHTFSLYFQSLKKDYDVIDVYYINESQANNYDFLHKNFTSEEEYNTWRSYPDANNMITPDTTTKYGDRYVTLQTCKPNTNATVKLIVVGKEVSSEPY